MTWWKVSCAIILAVSLSTISTVTLTGRNPRATARWIWQPLWSYIAVIQGLGHIGLFELDDIMNNLLGTAIGVGIYALVKKYCFKE